MNIELYMLKHNVLRKIEAAIRSIAWHLPKTLVMWCCYRAAAHATGGQWGNENPGDLKFFTMMERWDIESKL